MAGELADKVDIHKIKFKLFSSTKKEIPRQSFSGCRVRGGPTHRKIPREFFCGGRIQVPRSVSMPLIQPDFNFKSHPGKNSLGFFLWAWGLMGPCPEMVKKQIPIFPSP